jgi:site-specific DNA-methyltransferase (adenine-specific)
MIEQQIKPTLPIHGVTSSVFNEDCLETLNRFENNSIDCVITDPPYSGLLSKSKGDGRFANADCHIEFDDMSERAFLLFVKPIFRELYRVMKLGSHLYCFTDWKQLRNMADCLELASFKIVNIVCWDKGHFGMGAGYRSQSEYLLVFSKGLPNTFNLKNVGNVIKCQRAKDTIHPHQKPMELIKILIENSTKEGDLIYDPFAGSCSTLKTAKILNRNSIGSELSKDYCQQYTDTVKSELF